VNFTFKAICAAAAIAFCGCSSESTIAISDDLEYYVVDVGSYELNQNALQFTEGQCEVIDDQLVWSKNGPSHIFPALLDESTGSMNLTYSDYIGQYKYNGNTFPVGEFRSLNAPAKTADGFLLETDNIIKYILFKKDNCFFDDYDYPVPKNARRLNCNTAEENGLFMKFNPFEGTSIKVVFSAGKVSCDLIYKTRYSYNEQDCRDAYNDYLKDSSAVSFEFKNYRTEAIQDVNCMKKLKVELATIRIMNE
jgi:hypothetical protein